MAVELILEVFPHLHTFLSWRKSDVKSCDKQGQYATKLSQGNGFANAVVSSCTICQAISAQFSLDRKPTH